MRRSARWVGRGKKWVGQTLLYTLMSSWQRLRCPLLQQPRVIVVVVYSKHKEYSCASRWGQREREREPRGPFTCTCNNSFSKTWQRGKVGPEWKKKPIVAGDCEQCVICSCLREKIEVGGLSLERKKRDAREMCILDVVSLCGGGIY